MPDTRRSLSALQTLFADNASGDISPQDGRDELISSHPEKVVQTDTEANTPSSGQLTGDLFLPSNGFWAKRYSGSAWVPWGPLFPLTAPVSGDFTAVNGGGTSSLTTTYGGMVLADSTSTGSDNIRIYKKSAPSTPYTITAAILLVADLADASPGFDGGLCFRQSSDGKLHVFGLSVNSTRQARLVGVKYTNPTTFSAGYFDYDFVSAGFASAVVWLRIADNGTNRICSISADGQTWQAIHTIGRTDFLTADEVGLYIDPWGCAGTATLVSWKEG